MGAPDVVLVFVPWLWNVRLTAQWRLILAFVAVAVAADLDG